MSETYLLTESWLNIRKEVLERDRYECQHCGAENPVATLEVHHIIPVRLNGSDELENLIVLCQRCHNSLHYLGEDPKYPVSVLENAEEETDNHPLDSGQIDKRYSDNTPEGWSQDEWAKAIDDTEAPPKATLTTKTINGDSYYYYQWRKDNKIKSEYIAPASSSD